MQASEIAEVCAFLRSVGVDLDGEELEALHGLCRWQPKIYRYPPKHVRDASMRGGCFRCIVVQTQSEKTMLWEMCHLVTEAEHQRVSCRMQNVLHVW